MKHLLTLIMSLVAVFCVFAGCSVNSVVNDNGNGDGNGTEIHIDVSEDKKDGENQDGDNEEKPENNDDGQGEEDPENNDDGQGEEENTEEPGEDKPNYVIVDPITDGGDFVGGNYK